jgi:hypothetical protein
MRQPSCFSLGLSQWVQNPLILTKTISLPGSRFLLLDCDPQKSYGLFQNAIIVKYGTSQIVPVCHCMPAVISANTIEIFIIVIKPVNHILNLIYFSTFQPDKISRRVVATHVPNYRTSG